MAMRIAENAFQRRKAKRRELLEESADPSRPRKARPLLDTIALVAQISLAVVAIFGYFYTVRPIYQKERLAEQVAEYEGIIREQKPKVAEIERQLAELQRERTELTAKMQRERDQLTAEMQRERARLTSELKGIERELSLALEEKRRIEDQTRFMTYRYRLPDGSPAVTPEQVEVAQKHDLKRSFLSSLSFSCGGLTSGVRGGAFLGYSYGRVDEKNKFWPFTDQEISAWNEHGAKYPLKSAIECIDSVAASFPQRQASLAAFVEGLRKDAVQYANREAAAKPWSPPVQPADIWQELTTRRASIDVERIAELKKVEEEYGNWESTFGDRRVLFKHNYEVSKQNAEVRARSNKLSLESQMQEKANLLRKSIREEVNRLVVAESRGDAK